jgi:hypothetical protein
LWRDWFDGLYADGATTGRMMVPHPHPWIMGQPWRIRHLDEVLGHISAYQGVWKARQRDHRLVQGAVRLTFRRIRMIHSATAGQNSHQKILSHRRRPVPSVDLCPGLRREDKEGQCTVSS